VPVAAEDAPSQPGVPSWQRYLPAVTLLAALIAVVALRVLPVFSFVFFAFLGALLATGLFSFYLIPRLWKRAVENAAEPRLASAYRLHAARGALIALAGLSLLMLPLEIGAEFFLECLVRLVPVLFLTIPLVSVSIRVLLRDHAAATSFRQEGLVRVSRVLTAGCWLFSGVLVAATIQVFQLWPVSLRDGPDTTHARGGFEQLAGFAAPSSVDQLYFRRFLFWQTDDVHLKFRYHDPAVARRFLAAVDVEPAEAPQTYARLRDRFPESWISADKTSGQPLAEFYQGGAPGDQRFVWIDREDRTVYFLSSR
jgi:hypothetical protein